MIRRRARPSADPLMARRRIGAALARRGYDAEVIDAALERVGLGEAPDETPSAD